MITEELKNALMKEGLTKQQAESSTAEKVVKALMPSGGSELISEVKRQCEQMLEEAKEKYSELMRKCESINLTMLEILRVEKEYAGLTDERVKNAISLYATIMGINTNNRKNVDLDESIKTAGYVTYAYLGGQARGNVGAELEEKE